MVARARLLFTVARDISRGYRIFASYASLRKSMPKVDVRLATIGRSCTGAGTVPNGDGIPIPVAIMRTVSG